MTTMVLHLLRRGYHNYIVIKLVFLYEGYIDKTRNKEKMIEIPVFFLENHFFQFFNRPLVLEENPSLLRWTSSLQKMSKHLTCH